MALLAVDPNESWIGAFGMLQVVLESFCRGFCCDAERRFGVAIEVHIERGGGLAEGIIFGFEFFIEEPAARFHTLLKMLIGVFAGGAIPLPFVAIDKRGSFGEAVDEAIAEFTHEVAADGPEVEAEEFDFWVFGAHGFADEFASFAGTSEVIFLCVLGTFPIGFGFLVEPIFGGPIGVDRIDAVAFWVEADTFHFGFGDDFRGEGEVLCEALLIGFAEPIRFGLVGHCHKEIVGVFFELDLFIEFDLVFDVVVHFEVVFTHDVGDTEVKDEAVKRGFGFHLSDILFELGEGWLAPAIMDDERVFGRGRNCGEDDE